MWPWARYDIPLHPEYITRTWMIHHTHHSRYGEVGQPDVLEMGRSIGWAMSPLPRGTQNKGLAGSLYRLTSTTLRSTDA